MTALKDYARLETTGRWRAAPGEAAREVAVAFGDASLVLSDDRGPLTHWSLPAVLRLNPGQAPALYAPDEGGTETVEIDDDEMTRAIERVRASVARGRPGPRRMRRGLALGALAAGVALGALWLPGALRREALAVVPAAKRSELGATILGHLQRAAGPACRDPLGSAALERLRARVLGPGGQAVVLPDGPAAPLVLPGGIVVLPAALVEAAAEPAVVAGHLLAASPGGGGADGGEGADGAAGPLGLLLDRGGTWATVRLLATGEVDPDLLAAHAAGLLAAPLPPADAATLGPAFARAEVALSPYALALDPTGGSVAGLLAADAYADPGAAPPLLLADAEWVALQNVCRSGA